MLAALVVWIYLGGLCYLYGAGALTALARWSRQPLAWKPGLPLLLIFGLCLFGTLAAFFSLALPLGALSVLLLTLGAVLSFALARPPQLLALPQPRAMQWLTAVALLLAALIVLENATQPPTNPDTNLYHAQTIHWIESFRAVPGLGNLSGRLAANSDWLVINAATSFAFLGLRSFHLVAGFVFLIAAAYFAEGLSGLAQQPALLSNWLKVLLLPLAFRTLTGEISSPGTDLPVILLTWLLVALAAEHVESAGSPSAARSVLVGILPAFIVTLKLSAAPLLMLSAYIFIDLLQRRQRRAAWTEAGALLFVLLPWLLRSLVLSGYLVFPYSRLDLFPFDWKMPASDVDAVRNAVIGWARLPNKDWTTAVQMPLRIWLPAWFAEQTLNQRLMIVAALLSLLVLLLRQARRYLVVFLVMYVGVWFWLFTAPNLRFGYGFLLGAVAFAGAAFLASIVLRLPRVDTRAISAVASGLLVLLLGYTLISSFDSQSLSERLLLPADYRKFKTDACVVGDLQISCATAYKQCGYESFPCVPDVPSGVFPRGPALQDGFYSVK